MLAGHSTGGTYALNYAAQYPQQVAGVALIDSATPYQFDLPDYPSFYSTFRRVFALFPSLARAGIARPTLGTGFATLPPDARDQARTFASSPRELRANRNEFLELPTVFEQAKALKSLGNKPLAVLSADRDQQRGWATYQEKLARLSSNSVHRTARGSDTQRSARRGAVRLDHHTSHHRRCSRHPLRSATAMTIGAPADACSYGREVPAAEGIGPARPGHINHGRVRAECLVAQGEAVQVPGAATGDLLAPAPEKSGELPLEAQPRVLMDDALADGIGYLVAAQAENVDGCAYG